jgi:hypothetical protein
MHAHPIGAVGRPQVFDQGFSGLVLQLFQGWSADLDRQPFGLGFQVAGPFSQNAEHDLLHGRVCLSFRFHLCPAGAFCQVRPNTGNRPRRDRPALERGNQTPHPRGGIFPNDAAITRLVGAVLLEQDEHWQLEGRRMCSAESMAAIPSLEELPTQPSLQEAAV